MKNEKPKKESFTLSKDCKRVCFADTKGGQLVVIISKINLATQVLMRGVRNGDATEIDFMIQYDDHTASVSGETWYDLQTYLMES